ncbi:retrovirus-related pol polyprotein from transposon TNT 1-94 [Tanacetum coccineum]|uniref:Retrovirus-related pol polyprotein from transposon TNT 1-94 n=1 Tax=Tanacetum coccineum TaxID=301880 RepID=A0ABQ5C5B7_9ASTR
MAAVEVPQTLEYRGGQLNVAPVLEMENFTNWKKRFMCHILGIEPQFKNIIKMVLLSLMTAGQRKPKGQWIGDERKAANLNQNTNYVKDFELASLFGKVKYKENLIDSIYKTKKNKSLVFATPLSTAFISTSIVQDFQDSPDDEEDTRSSHEYLNDLEKVYQAIALLAKSKRFFKKDTQRFSSAKATDQTECHKCGKKGHFARDYWSKALDEEEVSSDDNEMVEFKVPMALAEENDAISKEGTRNGEWVKISMRKVLALKQAKLDFLTMHHVNTEIHKKNKNLINELKELTAITETWLNNSNKVNQCISEQIPSQKKRILGVNQLTKDLSSSRQKDLVFVKSSADDTKVILLAKSQRNTTDLSVVVTDSLVTDYDSADESSVCITPLPPLKKLDEGVKINEPSSAPAKGNKSSSALKNNLAHAGKLKSVQIKDDPPLAIVIKELNNLKLQISKNQSSYREIINRCEACGSSTHTTTDHYDIKWFKRDEVLQAKKAEALKSTRCDIRKPIWYLDSGHSRHMTGVKSYLHKYMEQPRPKVVFGDDSTCVTEGYGSIKCNGIVFTKVAFVNGLKYNLISSTQLCDVKYIVQFDEKRGIIFNSNKEIVMIAPRDKPCSSCEKGKHHKARFKIKQTSSIKKYLHLLHMDLFGHVTPRSINHEKYTLVIVDEYSSCLDYIHNHKDHLGKFDEKADDGYRLGYSLVSKAFRFFNTRKQQTEETYHTTFNKIPDAIKFSKPLVDNINIAKNERYPPDEYLHPYEPSQRYHINNNYMSFIEPYECPEPVVLETKVSSDQNGQTDQNDQSVQNDEILNDDHS